MGTYIVLYDVAMTIIPPKTFQIPMAPDSAGAFQTLIELHSFNVRMHVVMHSGYVLFSRALPSSSFRSTAKE